MSRFERQKEIERAELELFREMHTDFPDGEIEPSESPDFLIVGPTTIGIELTTLYWEAPVGASPRQAQESLRNGICQKARALWEERSLPPVHVSAHFNQNHELGRADVDGLAGAIVSVVSRILPQEEGLSIEDRNDVENADLPDEINTIAVLRVEELVKSFFSAPDAAFIPDLSSEAISRAIASKDSKYETYRGKCSEAWLVINICGVLSTTFDVVDEALDREYSTAFERVFILDHSSRRLWELKVGGA